jgi:AcrR family transcriptional regulator
MVEGSTTTVEQRRERAHDVVRDDIVAAAWRLAERDGLAGLSLRDLAAEVGMRAPSLYTYFSGKAAIYDAMFAAGYAQLHEHLEATFAAADGLERVEMLGLGIERWLGFCQESTPRYQLLFTRALPGWEPSPDAYAVSVTAYEAMAQRLAELGIEGQRTLDLYTALTAGLAAQQLANDPQGDRWVRLVPEAMEMFVRHLEREERS